MWINMFRYTSNDYIYRPFLLCYAKQIGYLSVLTRNRCCFVILWIKLQAVENCHSEETLMANHTTPLQVMEVMQGQHLLWHDPVVVDGHWMERNLGLLMVMKRKPLLCLLLQMHPRNTKESVLLLFLNLPQVYSCHIITQLW